jgi:hypothetical protein
MQFVYPYVLFGLVALAIPVIIHLFDFKRPQRVFFTNVRFLRELKTETRRRSYLKHLLVLLMRLMALAAIIIAFAMPVRRHDKSGIHTSGKPLVIVYLDNSYSMQGIGAGGMLFEEAIRRAGEIAAHYAPSDEFYLVTNDFSGRYSRVVNRSDFMEMVTTVQLSPVTRTGEEITERLFDVARKSRGRDVVVYLISDFQRSTVNITATEMDPSFPTYLVPVKPVSLSNLYIDSVWMEVPVVRPGQVMALDVRVGNAGSVPAEEVPVSLVLNGRETGVGTVTVPAGGSAVVRLSTRISQEGIYHGVVALDDHPVVFDDRFYLGFEVREQRTIGAFYGTTQESHLSRLFEGDSLFRLVNRPVTQIDFATIHQYDIIFCQGVTEISSALTEALRSYVEEGGTLVVVPPDPPHNPTIINPLLQILGVATYALPDTHTVRLGTISFDHRLFQGVYTEPPANMAMPTAYIHYPLISSGAPGEVVIKRLLNDRPLLLSGRAGRGLVYLFATSFSSDMTNLASHPEVFVPALFNMALYSGVVPPLYYIAGLHKAVSIQWPDDPGQTVFRMRSLEGETEFIPGYRSEPFGALLFFEDQVSRSGNFRVMYGELEVAPVAFNYSYLESDLSFDEERALSSWIRQEGLEHIQVIIPGGRSLTEKLANMRDGIRLWRWFVIAALCFLLAESLLLRFWRDTPKINV